MSNSVMILLLFKDISVTSSCFFSLLQELIFFHDAITIKSPMGTENSSM